MFLVVVGTEALLVDSLDLTGHSARAPPVADETAPYYVTAEVSRPRPKPLAVARRLRRARRPTAAASPPSPRPPAAPAPGASAQPPAPVGAPAPDYGRWTVAPGAWQEGRHEGIVMSVCDPTRLASLPPGARKACTERLQGASAAGPPAPRGAAADWKTAHTPMFCKPKTEAAHKLLLDHCSGVGPGVGVKLKYKF